MSAKLEGRTAIVTGAGRGVGRGVALLMAREGAKVVVADNGSAVDGSGHSAGPAEAVAAEITSAGGTALANAGDVSDWNDAEALVAQPIEAWGKLDILVNVAGNFRVNTVASVTRDDWNSVRRVHMDGMMHTSHFASLHWKERGEYGRLINFTSDSAMSGVPDTFGYAAAKGAVIGLTRAAANGLVAYGVTANCLTQASMTRMGDSYYGADPDSGRVPSEQAEPEQRPETVAPLVVYLASPAAGHISGRIFGSYGYQYIRWSEPHHERTLESKGPWDLDDVFARFPGSLGEGL
ncbi:MAG: SDR family oxidoreductase, partial [Pseudomonadales bacterium]|nr:SDR family oxidoreductase [Pseudomonadales bacterium]NIX09979.1 SDR family oxidoreductase [Pseudomonadales bacterium]